MLFAFLAALSIAAGAVRWHAAHLDRRIPDEDIAQAVVTKVLDSGSLDTNWIRTDVESRFKDNEYNFSSYYLTAALYEKLTGRAWDDTHNHKSSMVGHIRELSAILGALCVFFTGVLGWRVGGGAAALTAALLTACSPLLFQDSLYARPETFVTLLGVIWMIMLTAPGRHGGLILAFTGLLTGILIATKITFLVYLPFPLLLATRLIDQGGDLQPHGEPHHNRWTWTLGAYFCLVGAGFALGAPYALKFPSEYLQGVASLFGQYEGDVLNSGGEGLNDLLGRLEGNLAYFVYTMGYLALLLAACGAAKLAIRRDLWRAAIFTAPLLLLLYFLRMRPLFERNFSQSLPAMFVLAGLGVKAIVDLIRVPASLRAVIAALLAATATLMPALVTAKILHPSLDGAFQTEIDAKTKSIAGDGQTAVFETEFYDGAYCGHYVYMLKQPGHERDIETMLSQGFRIVAEVASPFSGHTSYTLEPYYAPTIVYLAPPQKTGACAFNLEPLKASIGMVPVSARVVATGGWIPKGDASGVPSDTWRWPLYDSRTGPGGDRNTGTLSMGPFRACGSLAVPYSMGPGHQNFSLKVSRRQGKQTTVIFDGILPGARYQWQTMVIDAVKSECADYSVEAVDNGTSWGQWLGVGLPVQFGAMPGR